MRRSLFTVPWMVMSVTGANSDPEARPGYAVKSRRQAMPRCFILKAARHSESRGDRSQGELMLVAHAQEVAHLPVPDELVAWVVAAIASHARTRDWWILLLQGVLGG